MVRCRKKAMEIISQNVVEVCKAYTDGAIDEQNLSDEQELRQGPD